MRRLFIIRKDLHLSSGKLAAMVAHCAEAYWMKILTSKLTHTMIYDGKELVPTKDYAAQLILDGDIVDNYINASFVKTICEARNLNQLQKVEQFAAEHNLVKGVDYGYIDDNCLTELTPDIVGDDGVPRCRVGVWFKPLPDDISHSISGHYKLYRD